MSDTENTRENSPVASSEVATRNPAPAEAQPEVRTQPAPAGQVASRGSDDSSRANGGPVARRTRDPFEMVQRLSQEMDDLFESVFYGRPFSGGQTRLRNLWSPEVEIAQSGEQLRIWLDLPGVAREDVKIDAREGSLTIEGERRETHTNADERGALRRSERRFGRFYRSIPLPEGAQAENAEARLRDGVLEIVVPMAAKRVKRLEIQS